jgi:hypothetical protein
MWTRRSFAVLLAAGVAGTALAGMPPPLLEGRYAVTRAADGTLSVRLFLANRSSEPLPILHMSGAQPGPRLVALAGKAPLAVIESPEPATRAGPRPTYLSLAPGAELEVGPWRLRSPERPRKRVTLSAVVVVQDREPVTLPEQTVTVGSS